ncbi:unnamed protein product [Clavelina lepadiformis]|uniref:BTB domain-containing protein n=1 Tax=Clavelina lepadiformis TaxID=159417 RepID=A0ABP0H0J5_CLALP
MGNWISGTNTNSASNDEFGFEQNFYVDLHNKKNKKRGWEVDDKESESSHFVDIKRKKLKTTSQFIYNALFLNGESSDVTIKAFDHEWNLHKVYLRQAGYFSGMFNGDWKESTMNEVHLQIPDEKIDKEALHITFGSLYTDEVIILPGQVISVLAAASLLQLESLMQQCSEVMVSAICCDNVYHFYNEARLYGQVDVEKACISWLENNLMLQSNNYKLLEEIDPVLMSRIVSSKDIFVLQVEMDLYIMLKKWLYLKLTSNIDDLSKPDQNANTIATKYFRERQKDTGEIFLISSEGEPFKEAFQGVHICNIMRDFGCCLELEKDGIVPDFWILPLFRECWLAMLRVEQGIDRGPNKSSGIDDRSLRCGRILHRDMDYCWRWNGYNFGLDLLVTYSSQEPKALLLKRNFQSQRKAGSVGLGAQRKINFQIKVFSLNSKGQILNMFSTGCSSLSLEKDEERVALTIHNEDSSRKLEFPLLISATFQVLSDHDMNNSYTISPVFR